ncbi:MAG: hypothetical protein ACYC39_09425 [Thiobacillus sp.]
MNTVENPDGPWTKPWPAAGLDLVAQCPVCGKSERGILHPELIDNVFGFQASFAIEHGTPYGPLATHKTQQLLAAIVAFAVAQIPDRDSTQGGKLIMYDPS